MSYIQIATGVSGQNLYATFYDHERGWIWDNVDSSFRNTSISTSAPLPAMNYSSAWSNVCVALAEDTGSSSTATGHYQLKVPTALENQVESVDVVIRRRVGGSPLVTDPVVGAGAHTIMTHASYQISKAG